MAIQFLNSPLYGDNVKIEFGNSSDLQIYHDGTNSEIKNNTGGLLIKTDTFRILNSAGTEQMFRADVDDAVQLYFNNAVKLATTSSGVNVSGDVTINNSSGDFGAEAILRGTTSTGTPKSEIAFKRFTSGDGATMVLRTSNSSGTIQDVLTLDISRSATFSGNVAVKDGANFYGANDTAASSENSNYVASFGKSTNGSAKFAGNITVGSGSSTFEGSLTVKAKGSELGSSGYYINSQFSDVTGGANVGVIIAHNDTTNGAGAIAGINSLAFLTYGTNWTQALLLDSSQNATFTGAVTVRSGNKLILNRPNNAVASEISTDTSGTMILNSVNDEGFKFQNAGTTFLTLDTSDNATFAGDVSVEDNLYLTDAGTTRAKIQLNASDRDDLDIKAISLGSNMKFFTVDTERMRITSGGALLVGTTSPQTGTKLQVAGVVDVWSSANTLLRFQHDGTRGIIETFTGGGYSNTAINPNGGNVGIATNSPTSKLHVADSSGGAAIKVAGTITDTAVYYYGFMHDATDLQGTTQVNTFYSGGAIKSNKTITDYAGIRIDTPNVSATGAAVTNNYAIYQSSSLQKNYFAGNVGIGTISPFANASTNTGLNIDTGGHSSLLIGDGVNYGGMIQSSDNSQRVIIGANVYDSPTASWSRFTADSAALIDVYGEGSSAFISLNVDAGTSGFPTARLYINNTGEVGIGTTAPTGKLEIQRSQVTTQFDRDSFLRLHPSATTNSGGLTNIFFGTSTTNNFGVAVGGRRGGTGDTSSNNNPEFSVRILNDAITGTEVLNINTAGNATFAGSLFLPDNRDIGWNGGFSAGKPTLAAAGTTIKMFPSGSISGLQFSLTPTDATFAGNVVVDGSVAVNTEPLYSRELLVKGEIAALAQDSGGNQLLLSASSTQTNISSTFNGAGSYAPMQFETGGAIRMQLTASGNLGIGTTSPTRKLTISDNSAQVLLIDTSSSNTLEVEVGDEIASFKLDKDGAVENSKFVWSIDDASRMELSIAEGDQSQLKLNNYGSGTITGTAAYTLQVDDAGNVIEGSTSGGGTVTGTGVATRVAFWSGTSALSSDANLYWDNTNDRLGIGTTAPSTILHTKNTSGDNRGILIENTVVTSYAELAVKAAREFRVGTGGSSTGPNGTFYVYDATAAKHRLDITSDGDVQARRPRNNTAGQVALSLQPTDSTIHYGFRIESTTNSFNLDRVDSAAQLLRVDVSGNATFAGNIVFGDNHFIGNGSGDNLSIQSSTGEAIVLDSSSDIVLDAAGNDISLQAAGTEFGKLSKGGSSDFLINSSINDKDIIFTGIDGGSAITALTLDMSNGGSATFRDDIDFGGKITQTGTGTNTFAGDITVSNATPSLTLTDTDNSTNIILKSVGGALVVNSASDQVYEVASSEKMRLNSNGLGIGDTNPSYPLVVSKASASTSNGDDSSVRLTLTNTNTTANNYSLILFNDGTSEAGSGAMGFQYTDHTNDYGDLCFITRGAAGYKEKMRIKADGSILQQGPAVGGTNTHYTWQYGNDSNFRLDLKQNVGSGIVKHIFDLTNNGTSYASNLVLDRGNVGIGTSAPAARLDVIVSNVSVTPNGNSSAVFRQNANNYITILSGTNNEGGLLFGNSADAADGWIAYQNGSGNQFIGFGTANSEKMRITSTGSVGIGTSNPGTHKLAVNGTFKYGSGLEQQGAVSGSEPENAPDFTPDAYLDIKVGGIDYLIPLFTKGS